MTDKPTSHPGDLIQITDEKHPTFPAVMVVLEARAWGVATVPPLAAGVASRESRLKPEQFVTVGALHLMPNDLATAREASIETAALLSKDKRS